LLVTSRVRLNLLEEWTLPLEGLPVPEVGTGADGTLAVDSVALFLKKVTQYRPDVRLSDVDTAAVAEICRLVEGYPLAIEIAASWVRALPVSDIAAALVKGIDVLHRPTRNVPDRHRSMRATLEHSWTLLSEDEQEGL